MSSRAETRQAARDTRDLTQAVEEMRARIDVLENEVGALQRAERNGAPAKTATPRAKQEPPRPPRTAAKETPPAKSTPPAKADF